MPKLKASAKAKEVEAKLVIEGKADVDQLDPCLLVTDDKSGNTEPQNNIESNDDGEEGQDAHKSAVPRLLPNVFKHPNGSPYISTCSETGNGIVSFGDKQSTMDYIAYDTYRDTGKFPKKKHLKQDYDELRLLGLHARPVVPVCYRTQALMSDGVEIKINNAVSLKITPKFIELGSHAGKFWSPDHELPLAIPDLDPNSSIEPYINALGIVDPDDRVLLIGMLLIYLFHKGPYPILVIKGPHGSGKSTFVSNFKSLIDPYILEKMADVTSARDLYVVASQNFILNFDNVSEISDKLYDAHCTIATGAARAERKLYTNSVMTYVITVNPQIFNGIPNLALREDFNERLILIILPVIQIRQSLAEYQDHIEAAKPGALGHLANAMQMALKKLPVTETPQGLRMADAAKLVTAAEECFGWEPGTFVAAYKRNQIKVIHESMAEIPLYSVLKSLLDTNNGHIEGTPMQVLDQLTGEADSINREIKDGSGWPKAPNALSRVLNRLEGTLATLGITLIQRGGGERLLSITDNNFVAPNPESDPQPD